MRTNRWELLRNQGRGLPRAGPITRD